MASGRERWCVPSSCRARDSHSAMLHFPKQAKPNVDKENIVLASGDPTLYGNMSVPDEIVETVITTLKGNKCNGYVCVTGSTVAKRAVAKYITSTETPVRPEDIIITSGCSGALDWSICCLANRGQNILVPRPTFPTFKCICSSYGIEVKCYNILPERGGEMDLKQMESVIDQKTVAILINNPSIPFGVVYSKNHLLDVLALAERNKLPIIADEIYAHMVFSGSTYFSLGSLSKTVPILSCGSLSKRFLVPGWRIGWLVIHDRNDILNKQVRAGLENLASLVGGPVSILQYAMEDIFKSVPRNFFDDTIATLERNANLFFQRFMEIPGLKPVMPRAAFYMMVEIDLDKFPEFEDDIEMMKQLIREESVFCIPGEMFDCSGYFRVILTLPEDKINTACDRVQQFCARYYDKLLPDHAT